jgi:hypothetical protein
VKFLISGMPVREGQALVPRTVVVILGGEHPDVGSRSSMTGNWMTVASIRRPMCLKLSCWQSILIIGLSNRAGELLTRFVLLI